MSKILNWLKAKFSEENLVLVKVVTSDDVYHYRWMPENMTVNKLKFSPLKQGEKVCQFKSIELVDLGNIMVREDVNRYKSEIVYPKEEKLYCITTPLAKRVYIWSKDFLDALAFGLKPAFISDVKPISNIVSLKRVIVGDSFIYNNRVWDLRKGGTGHQVVTASRLCPQDV